jgi:hypothetical protein
MLKGDTKIRLWKQEVLADCVLQYTQLAVQLANLTARNLATLVHTPSKKKAPTGNKRERPKATEVIAKTNHKVDQFFPKKAPVINLERPMQEPEEEKKQEPPRGEAVEHIDTCSNPQPSPEQQPVEVRPTGLRKILVAEESKTEAFMTAKVEDPALRREQMAIDLRKGKRQRLLSKKRHPGQNQDQSFIQAPEELFEFP